MEDKEKTAQEWFERGIELVKKKNGQEALECFKKITELKPGDAGAWYNLGVSLAELNRQEEALACLKKSTDIQPSFAAAWNNQGIILAKINRHEEALKFYDKAIKLKLDLADPWYNKGITLGKLDRDEEALACYEKATNLKPNFAEAWNNKGNIWIKLNCYNKAWFCLNKSLELDSTNSWAYGSRGELYLKLGLVEKARAELESALKLEERYFDLYIFQGRVELESKNYSEALAAFRQAIEKDPENCPARLWAVYARYLAAEFAVNKEPALKNESAKVLKCEQESLCRLVKHTAFREEISHVLRELDNLCQAAQGETRDYAFYLSGYLYYRLEDYPSAVEKLRIAQTITLREDRKNWKAWLKIIKLWHSSSEQYLDDMKSLFKQMADFWKTKYGIKKQAGQLLYHLYSHKSSPAFYNWWFFSPVNWGRRFLGGLMLAGASLFLLIYPLLNPGWEILQNQVIYTLVVLIVLAVWFLPTASRMKMKDLEFDLAAPPPVELSPARMEGLISGLQQ